jgi:hypothetical protein
MTRTGNVRQESLAGAGTIRISRVNEPPSIILVGA